MSKTLAEINELKRSWLNDPCWDIYATEGFEEHEVELRQFQAEQEKIWADARRDRLFNRSIELGIGGNTLLVQFIETLEKRIAELEDRTSYGISEKAINAERRFNAI